MDFDLDDDQLALRDMVRRFCADRFPLDVVRAAGDGLDRDRWRELAGLGVFALTRPEAAGGAGLSLADAAVVFEELGRALAPGPVVASFLAAGAGDGAVDGVAEGEVVATLVERWPGRPLLVEHAESADVVLVLDDDGVTAFDAAGLAGRAVAEPLDPTTPLALVDELPDGGGRSLGGPELAREWRRTGSLLTAALLVGIAGATTDLAVAYAKDRRQFGRPIGSFQAVKHILADMFARAEVARAAVHAGAVTADRPEVGDPDRAVAAGRALAGRAAHDNAKACIQVHGGIGFTWEADPHLFLKRTLLHDTQLGSVDEAAEAVAATL
ncbi:MAG TPA: acyl-CoA dehydrogenase family protein [Acidimicrobiales bacterium]